MLELLATTRIRISEALGLPLSRYTHVLPGDQAPVLEIKPIDAFSPQDSQSSDRARSAKGRLCRRCPSVL